MATARRSAPPAARRTAPAQPVSSGYRGAEGAAKAREEEAANEARKEASAMNAHMPYRFFCPVGESREVVIVDDHVDFYRYEHNLKNNRSGKFDIFTACMNENANCPVCKNTDRPSYFAMYLTVIDLTPYINKDNEEVPWSKKLLVVKTQGQKKIMRLQERYGSLRGMVIQLTRDSDKDANIGNDIEYIETLTEDDLLTYETSYVDKKNVEHDVLGHEIFDYDDLFPMPTEEQLRAVVGGRPEPGSRDGDRQELRGRGAVRGRGDDWDDQGAARPAVRRRAADDAPPARGAVTRRAAPPPEAEDEPAPRTAVRRGRVAPADEDIPVEDAAPARTVARRPAPRAAAPVDDDAPQRTARPVPVRRAAAPAEPPASAATSMAERRRALRR